MIESVKELGAKLEIDALGKVESLHHPQVEVPKTWTPHSIASDTELPWLRNTEETLRAYYLAAVRGRIAVRDVENHWTLNPRLKLQLSLRQRPAQICSRLFSGNGEIGGSRAAVYRERLAALVGIDAGQCPITKNLV